MDFHLCKSRRGSNPEAVVNCNSPGTGGVTPGTQNDIEHTDTCSRGGPLSIHICPTTGGLFHMNIAPTETIDGLKRTVAKKLGVSHDRIRLLYRDRLLKDGSLKSNHLSDGCHVTLLPHVETGLSSPHPEVTVTQALENLTDSQVNDFLAGKSPLTLAMKLGKHMMFLQLQLSTVPHGAKRSYGPKSNMTRTVHQPGQSSPRTLNVPSAHQLHHRKTEPIQSQAQQPHSIVTPPPSPKSPSSNSHYTYPAMPLPSPSLTSTPQCDAMFDPINNTPPPSPCYVHKPIPTVPVMKTANPEPCHKHTDTGTDLRTPHSQSANPGTSPPTQGVPFLDSSTLAAAKRSLSMKLKEISKEKNTEESRPPGAVIETMQRLGHGVYSGTFSGFLNPALQDSTGKPRKSISTIVHILNDLLGASHPGLGQRARVWLPPQGSNTTTKGATPKTHLPTPATPRNESPVKIEDLEESKTIRGKVERLQMKLEERRLMRQARRKARGAPYTTGQHKGQDHPKHDIMDTDCDEEPRSADD